MAQLLFLCVFTMGVRFKYQVKIKALVNHLPDDVSIKDVQYHIYVLEKLRNIPTARFNFSSVTL